MAPRAYGRAAVYLHAAQAGRRGDASTTMADVTSSVSYVLTDRESDGAEFGIDLRHSASTVVGRDQRVSVYDGYVGRLFAGGTVRLRAGHMWLNDLGALGSVAGALVEVRQSTTAPTGLGRWRGAAFAGLEPNNYRGGYADRVRKAGGYVALEGRGARRHVAGYVNVKHAMLTERSVLSVANYLPVGRSVFVYQSGEYDLQGPAGQGRPGLAYFFTNARASLGRRLEVLGTVSRGRSIDVRTISDDVLAGRPVAQRSVDGLLYQSYGGRATVEVLPRVRVHVGYSRDRNNRDDAPTGRWLTGGYASNLFGSGLDATVSSSYIARPTGSYRSTYASLGRMFGSRTYLTGEFTTSLSVVRFTRSDGVVVETLPHTRQLGGSATVNLTRSMSLFVTGEQTFDGDYRARRLLTGLTYRLR